MTKQGYRGQTIATLALLFLTLCSGFVLASHVVSADDVIDYFTININVSCTLFNNVGTAHTAEVPNGTYETDIGTTTIKAYCNDTNGFSIYAIGYTGEEYGNNTLVGTNNSSSTIATGTATSGDTSNWAMKLGAVSGTYTPTILNSFDSYHAVPSTYTQVAKYTSGTDVGTTMANASGSSITTTYASYISYTQAADTYAGKVKYTLVHPNDADTPPLPQTTASGKICYYANASDAVGTMGCQNIAASVTLLASNFSRAGYGFAGWSDAFDYASNANAHFYGPQETITLTLADYQSPNNGLSLYAVWVKSAGSLQDTNKVAELCGNTAQSITGTLTTAPTDGTVNLSSVSALTDQRDSQTYAIAKLADGKCWMIENLRLEAENTRTAEKQALAQGYGSSTTYGNFTGLADAESANFTTTNPPVANSLYSTDGTTTNTIQGGNSSDYYARMPRYNNINTSTRASSPTGNTVAMYSYGNYYTWSAAMANVKEYTSATSTDDEGKTSETANTSLCPTGWRLPYGRNTGNGTTAGGFYNLNYKINNDSNVTNSTASLKLRSFPNNFLYSGRFDTSSAYNRGSFGYYWSSTSTNNGDSYNLYLNSSGMAPGTSNSYKCNGYSIRCTVGS